MKKMNFIAGIIMAIMPFIAQSQQTQTPINITTLTAQPSPAQFTSYGGLNATFTFNTQNTTNAQFCQGTDTCTLPTASSGPNAYTVSNTRWGTYKLNNPNAGSCSPSVTFNGLQYCLLEFHFHGPSEHWVNNSATDLEVHFVYFKLDDFTSSPTGLCNADSLLVLGQRMVGNGATPNSAWTSVFNAIPAVNNTGAYSGQTVSFNIASMMGIANFNTAPSYRYSGGLTAPISIATLGLSQGTQTTSCVANTKPGAPYASNLWWGNPQRQLTQGAYPQVVSWVLFRQPIQLSVAQVQQFKTAFPDGNARAVQPNGGATVYFANPN
jgi:carbonic anhydrase